MMELMDMAPPEWAPAVLTASIVDLHFWIADRGTYGQMMLSRGEAALPTLVCTEDERDLADLLAAFPAAAPRRRPAPRHALSTRAPPRTARLACMARPRL